MTWSTDRYCDAIGPEIGLMAAAGTRVDPAAPVPTCPGWTTADLLRHVGAVHRWAAAMVEQLAPKRLRRERMDLGLPDDDAQLPAWLTAGAAPLLAAFRDADPDAGMWAWGTDQHVRFWPRRMLHETCIHRVDAESAAGVESVVDPEVAADGIEEFLVNLPAAASFSPSVEKLRGADESLRFAATDTGEAWRITLEPDAFRWRRETGPDGTPADATLTGPVADLCLVIYGRLPVDHPGIERSGDLGVLDLWLTNAKI